MQIKEEASLDKVLGVVILHILPEQDDLKPPINNEDPGKVGGKYILYDDKLFELYENPGDGLCLLDSVSLFFRIVHDTTLGAIACRPKFFDKNHERGYDLPYIVQFLLEFLCTLSKKDFDPILYNYSDEDDLSEPTLSSEYEKFAKKLEVVKKYLLWRKANRKK
jgi:hypothetical protein